MNKREPKNMDIRERVESVLDNVKEKMGFSEEDDSEYFSSSTGEFKREFINDINSNLAQRIDAAADRPMVEVWPFEDEDSHWIASHQQKERAVICDSPEFRDTPFCGTGAH
jgi:hypothetical protein